MSGDLSNDTGSDLSSLAKNVRGAFSSVEDMTCNFIREAIFRGLYRPGQRLHQDSIAEVLGVSRMPVRSSLRQLAAEGLVVFEPHRGATVHTLKPADIAEVYELRVMLETRLLELAFERLDPEMTDQLIQLAEQLEAQREPSSWYIQRQDLYQRLYELADRPRLQDLVFRLRAEVGAYLLRRKVIKDHSHAQLMRLLKAGDLDAAKAWLRRHLESVSEELQAIAATEIASEAQDR